MEIGFGQPFLAPAKLNLSLRITGRRDDGYHLLESEMELLGLCDTLFFFPEHPGVVKRLWGAPGVSEENDLAVRSARLLQTLFPQIGVALAIRKSIPMGAGLGGGSSDAAVTIIALNHLFSLGLDQAEMMALGARLGADVPFFIFGEPALATGIGESLLPRDFTPGWVVVAAPSAQVSTRLAFSLWDEKSARKTSLTKVSSFGKIPFSKMPGNDLQEVVEEVFPEVARVRSWLSSFGAAQMTGSGAAVFMKAASREEGESILRQAPLEWWVRLLPVWRRHPLFHLAHKKAPCGKTPL